MSFRLLKEDGTGVILAENSDGIKMEMTEKTVVGEEYWHVFESNIVPGTFVNQVCTQLEYNALEQPNCTNPTLNGHTWRYSFSDWTYNTSSGRLEDGCYVTVNGLHYLKLPNEEQKVVSTI